MEAPLLHPQWEERVLEPLPGHRRHGRGGGGPGPRAHARHLRERALGRHQVPRQPLHGLDRGRHCRVRFHGKACIGPSHY